LRDYLRGDKYAAGEYGKMNKRLAVQFGNDIDAYIDGKEPFIRKILEKTLCN
jgi:GrpB-like predicted nucleotidyltransferase (UPF0157 family)